MLLRRVYKNKYLCNLQRLTLCREENVNNPDFISFILKVKIDKVFHKFFLATVQYTVQYSTVQYYSEIYITPICF